MTPQRKYLAFCLFKYTLYAMLVVNVGLFLRQASAHDALDSFGWLVLLFIFEWETRQQGGRAPTRLLRRMLIGLQLAAFALLFYTFYSYLALRLWLDGLNAALWLLLAISIEIDMALPPGHPWRHNPRHHAAKWLLYVSLVAIAVAWGLQGDIFNFYDAFLWILCYSAIEVNMLRRWFQLRHGEPYA